VLLALLVWIQLKAAAQITNALGHTNATDNVRSDEMVSCC
jgi:hypothetical protein